MILKYQREHESCCFGDEQKTCFLLFFFPVQRFSNWRYFWKIFSIGKNNFSIIFWKKIDLFICFFFLGKSSIKKILRNFIVNEKSSKKMKKILFFFEMRNILEKYFSHFFSAKQKSDFFWYGKYDKV